MENNQPLVNNRINDFIKQNKVILLICSSVILLSLIILLFIVLYSSPSGQNNSNNILPTPTQSVSANITNTPTPTVNPTSPLINYYNYDYDLSFTLPSDYKLENYDKDIDCMSAQASVVKPICVVNQSNEKVKIVNISFGNAQIGGRILLEPTYGPIGSPQCQENIESIENKIFTFLKKSYTVMTCVNTNTGAIRSDKISKINLSNKGKYKQINLQVFTNDIGSLNVINKILLSAH